jgi:hypothetical protein
VDRLGPEFVLDIRGHTRQRCAKALERLLLGVEDREVAVQCDDDQYACQPPRHVRSQTSPACSRAASRAPSIALTSDGSVLVTSARFGTSYRYPHNRTLRTLSPSSISADPEAILPRRSRIITADGSLNHLHHRRNLLESRGYVATMHVYVMRLTPGA